MRIPQKTKAQLEAAIAYLFVFLFTYAAISKILDYHDFSIKIGQSPVFSAFADWVAVGVPMVEMLIVVLLCSVRSRFAGLFASFCLMVCFTAYIVIILNFSSYVPCSCGGILEDMGWNEHLIFNAVFVMLALAALFLKGPRQHKQHIWKSRLHFSLAIGFAAGTSILAVAILFVVSGDIMENRNSFIRRFESHARPEYNKYDLGLNSYYFAGIKNDAIYLGNVTTPLYITQIDTAFKISSRSEIKLDQSNLQFRDIHIKVMPPYFWVTDGAVPAVFTGKIKNWKAKRQQGQLPYFTLGEPVDSISIALRRTSFSKKRNTLALYSIKEHRVAAQNQKILEKQTDGIFDTDGLLLSDASAKRVYYMYYYRNEYLSADLKLQLLQKGKTIDTVSKAEIKVAKLSGGENQMARPPLIINKTAALYGGLLFIKSKRIGRFEDEKMLRDASIVDVYRLAEGSYVSSIYIYHVNGHEMTSFRVAGNRLYAISGPFLSVVKLDRTITRNYKVPSENK